MAANDQTSSKSTRRCRILGRRSSLGALGSVVRDRLAIQQGAAASAGVPIAAGPHSSRRGSGRQGVGRAPLIRRNPSRPRRRGASRIGPSSRGDCFVAYSAGVALLACALVYPLGRVRSEERDLGGQVGRCDGRRCRGRSARLRDFVEWWLRDDGDLPLPPGARVDFIRTFLYGVEGGYGIRLLDDVTLRAQIGVGNAEINTNDTSLTSNHFLYLEPGVTGMIAFGEGRWFVGADVSAMRQASRTRGKEDWSPRSQGVGRFVAAEALRQVVAVRPARDRRRGDPTRAPADTLADEPAVNNPLLRTYPSRCLPDDGRGAVRQRRRSPAPYRTDPPGRLAVRSEPRNLVRNGYFVRTVPVSSQPATTVHTTVVPR